jgi:hypothetical protein
VFTARYALSPYIKQICFVFKGLIVFIKGPDKGLFCNSLQLSSERDCAIILYQKKKLCVWFFSRTQAGRLWYITQHYSVPSHSFWFRLYHAQYRQHAHFIVAPAQSWDVCHLQYNSQRQVTSKLSPECKKSQVATALSYLTTTNSPPSPL